MARAATNTCYRAPTPLLDRMVAQARAHQIVPLLLLVPTECHVRATTPPDAPFDLRLPQRRVIEAVGDTAQVIDLLPAFQEEARRRRDPGWYRFERDGHFNVEGHAFVSAIIAAKLEGLLDRGAPTLAGATVAR